MQSNMDAMQLKLATTLRQNHGLMKIVARFINELWKFRIGFLFIRAIEDAVRTELFGLGLKHDLKIYIELNDSDYNLESRRNKNGRGIAILGGLCFTTSNDGYFFAAKKLTTH